MARPARVATRPVGSPTRGTTNTNRLRRVDRYLASLPEFARAASPLVVDLGFGASGVTSFELWSRLSRVRPDVAVRGLEIDAARVAAASAQLDAVRAGETGFDPAMDVAFARGGFEVPLPEGRSATVIRALNVLRQYPEAAVADAWALMAARLEPGGVLIEGTCDELGRICSWADVTATGPARLTISLRLAGLEAPSIVAERLPKALIHRNVPGERIHEFMVSLDAAWARAAGLAPYGPVQRWLATAAGLREEGWPVLGGRTRWRLGELTLPWDAVAPRA